MPRRRPGALRVEQIGYRTWERSGPPLDRIHGLSRRASLAVHLVERRAGDCRLHPGATERALRRYRAFVWPPGGRPRCPRDAECSCRGCAFDDVRHARDVLDDVVRRLPRRARAEPARRVAPLDAAYLACTLPDPFAQERQWRGGAWWRRRPAGGWS